MKVVLLCGGKGTRIRDVSHLVPKPMVEIGQYPIMWHIMKYYASYDHKEFILCLGHLGNVIKDFFLNYRASTSDITLNLMNAESIQYHGRHEEHDWKVTLAETGLESLTGTRIKKIEKYIGDDEHFFMTYGDGLGDIDLDKLLAFHKSHGKVLTVTGVHPPGRWGEMEKSPSGLVTNFVEKPSNGGGCISGGFFVCRRDYFNYLSGGGNFMLEEGPMKKLIADGELMLFDHVGFWHPMDTYRDFKLLNDIWEKGNAPWKRWQRADEEEERKAG